MKNLFKWTTLLVALTVIFQISCGEDEDPTPSLPDPTGKWVLSSATLVSPDPLVIKNFTTDGENFQDLSIDAGASSTQMTTLLVSGALAGRACADPDNYSTFYLELTSDGKLIFTCPNESVAEEGGSYVVLESDGEYSITLNVSAAGTTLPITVSDFVLAEDKSTFTGTASGYPMVVDFTQELSQENLQFLSTTMVFTAVD